jgi:hypothetical protein
MGLALVEFRRSLEVARALITLEATYPDPPSDADSLLVQGLRGGATVLMVASFEDYLESMFAEHLARFDGNPPPVALTSLPVRIQQHGTFATLRSSLRGPRYQETSRESRLPSVYASVGRLAEGRLDPVAMSEMPANPSPDNVEGLFKAVGLPKVFSRVTPSYEAAVGPVASTFLKDKLREVVATRHVIAHTGRALGVSRSKLTEWCEFLDRVADLLDKELDGLVTSVLK